MLNTGPSAGIEIGAWEEFPVNEGAMCRKGWTSGELRGARDRITTPMVRDRVSGELRAAGGFQAAHRDETIPV